MADLVIEDQELVQRLNDIAAKEQRPVEAVLRSLLDKYAVQPNASEEAQALLDKYRQRAAETDPLEAFIGFFDDDITDMSTTVRETLDNYYRKRYGDST